ncbi:hypothetical protein CPB86DRAFT_777843 [Serendipita vermifera]|nr:hypothetical protein CPB86DRAFT_777843 [Serendipita vermifera]
MHELFLSFRTKTSSDCEDPDLLCKWWYKKGPCTSGYDSPPWSVPSPPRTSSPGTMEDPRPEKIHKTFSTFGPGNIQFHDNESDEESESSSRHIRGLVKPFVIKQWLHQGKLYREKKERVPSRFELFFDLVFVAISHSLSEVAAEHAGGAGLAQFILTFFPTWSIWSEFRAFVNASGTDDIIQRVGILYMMALLVGYTANASAISLAYGSPEGTHETTETSFTNETIHALTSSILAVEAPGMSKRDAALVTATVFYLLGRGLRIGFLLMYAVALPQFRVALLVQAVYHILGSAIYFPLLFVRSTTVIVTLASVGMAWDIGLRFTIGMSRHLQRIINPKKASEEAQMKECEERKEAEAEAEDTEDDEDGDHKTLADRHCAACDKTINSATGSHLPALNIEHFLERTAAFVVIVLGEMVLSVVYHASTSQVGFQRIYGIAICGLMTAFNLCWLYFDAECSARFVHALRRHWFAGTMFTTLHFPLCAALLIVSAAMSYFTKHETEAPEAIRWYFGGGLGCSMLCLAALGYTHRGLDPEGTTRISRRVQLIVRVLVGVALTCIPLAHNLLPLELMGIGAGLTSFLVIEETYGKLWRGEPLAKLSASEKAAAEVDARRNDEMIESPVEEKSPGNIKRDQ